ncbi:MAG: hypothetical protein B7X34_04745 [Acidobacteriia bacterium 12-62-4]|nr:MAG: hypothetical protein B7X34_04745 [Acidobacteriia bacterium 12-62-4]
MRLLASWSYDAQAWDFDLFAFAKFGDETGDQLIELVGRDSGRPTGCSCNAGQQFRSFHNKPRMGDAGPRTGARLGPVDR